MSLQCSFKSSISQCTRHSVVNWDYISILGLWWHHRHNIDLCLFFLAGIQRITLGKWRKLFDRRSSMWTGGGTTKPCSNLSTLLVTSAFWRPSSRSVFTPIVFVTDSTVALRWCSYILMLLLLSSVLGFFIENLDHFLWPTSSRWVSK